MKDCRGIRARVRMRFAVMAAALLLSVVPFGLGAQQPGKVYRIGFLSLWSPPALATPDEHQRSPFFQPFWEAMRQLGWREGQNIVMEERWADTQVERLPALATELVQMQVDLILAAATVETEAAKQATQTIPIVMVNSLDAVNTGLVASLSQPVRRLRGFERVTLRPGATRTVTFTLDRSDVGFYNNAGRFVVEPGRIDVYAGTSSSGGLQDSFTVAG